LPGLGDLGKPNFSIVPATAEKSVSRCIKHIGNRNMNDDRKYRRDETKRRLMKTLSWIVAGVIIVLGVAGAVIPDTVIAIGRHVASPLGLYAAALFRVGIGIVLILAARESRAPGTLRAIGFVVLVAGVLTPFFGVEGVQARLDWETENVLILRFEGVLFMFLGAVIVSAFQSHRPKNTR
jgi:hypothetical protein